MKRLKDKLFQNVSAASGTGKAANSAVETPVPERESAERSAVFDHLIAKDSAAGVAAIPAELVHLHHVQLPIRGARQRMAALPFALEDLVAQDLASTHFAICGTEADGSVLAAVLSTDTLERYMADGADRALVPEQVLLPPPAPGPDGAMTWRTYGSDDRVLVRLSDGTGFAVTRDMLQAVWQLAGEPAIENLASALPKGIAYKDQGGTGVTPSPILLQADLRQGAYRPSRGFARPLKWLAACLVLAGVGHLMLAALDASAQRRIADDLRAKATVALTAKLPDASPDDPPALVMRRLSDANRPQGGSGFLPLMDRVASALQAQGDAVQFQELSWSDGALRLTVEAANLDTIQQAQSRLDGAGLQVSAGSATASDGAARSELTVRP